MRLIKISASPGTSPLIADLAFKAGIRQVSVREETGLTQDYHTHRKEVVDIEAATPQAAEFLASLQETPLYRKGDLTITVRQPQSLKNSESMEELTRPLAVPTRDLRAELWQFSHFTPGLAGRITTASILLSYGLLRDQLLLIISGLLFLPMLPLLLACSVGWLSGDGPLLRQGLRSTMAAVALLLLTAILMAVVVGGPLLYRPETPPLVSLLLSAVVGVGAALADTDDTGKRELIGLAAAAQISITPAWATIALVLGSPEAAESATRFWCFAGNLAAILCTATATYRCLGVGGRP